jgi:hypothetical protein
LFDIVFPANTWGSKFNSLFFVFGTNAFDFKFLTSSQITVTHSNGSTISENRCKISQSSVESTNKSSKRSRNLKAHTLQTVSIDKTVEYSCKLQANTESFPLPETSQPPSAHVENG